MANYTKTVQTDLLTMQDVSASTVVLGTVQITSTILGGIIGVRFGRRSATASTASAIIRLEFSKAASGDNTWFPFAQFATKFAACEAEAVSGTVAAGQKVITVASTTNLAAGDIIFISNGTPANSEFARIKSIVSNTSVTVEDDLVNAATGCTIYDSAEIYSGVEVPAGAVRIRAVFDGSLFTQACAINVSLTNIDSIG